MQTGAGAGGCETISFAMTRPTAVRLQLVGVLLFAFIPLVLWLFVGHPEPIGVSLAAGILLMLGHRFLARPYMERVRPVQCLWCNRVPVTTAAGAAETLTSALPEELALQSGAGPVVACFCAGHRTPTARYFTFVERARMPLALGIFVPLLLLLGTLTAAAAGLDAPVETMTDVFRLVIGITVNVAAFGYLTIPPEAARDAPRVPFPLHNFFLLGVRALLWIFRLVGIWWILLGATGLWERFG